MQATGTCQWGGSDLPAALFELGMWLRRALIICLCCFCVPVLGSMAAAFSSLLQLDAVVLAHSQTSDRHRCYHTATHISVTRDMRRSIPSQLKWQTRCVACFPDKTGYLVGSIEGRVAVQHVDEQVRSCNTLSFPTHTGYSTGAACPAVDVPVVWTVPSERLGWARIWAEDHTLRPAYSPSGLACGQLRMEGIFS